MIAELGEELLKLAVVWNGKHLGFLALSSGNFSKTFFFFLIVLPYLPFLSVCDSLLLYLIAVFFHPHLALLMLLS